MWGKYINCRVIVLELCHVQRRSQVFMGTYSFADFSPKVLLNNPVR